MYQGMKILCVIDCLGSGGSQRQLIQLALGFREIGHNVSFLNYYSVDFYNSILEENGIPLSIIQEPNPVKLILKIRQFIRRGKFDSVVSFLEGPGFVCEISGIPFRKWKMIAGERSNNPGVRRSVKRIIFRWFHFLADYVVSNSYAGLKTVMTVNPLLPKLKCKVIYNIVDLDLWKPLDNFVPLSSGKLKIIVMASHQFLKNLNGLVDALSILNDEEREKIIIDWYGDKLSEPYYSESYPLARKKISDLKLGHIIHFYPATTEICQKIVEADVVGLFSFYEGLPNAVCEGMACGKTIICSAVSDLPLLLSADRNLLFNPSDPGSIAGTLKYLLTLGREQLISIGAENRRIAEAIFDKRVLTDSYLQLMS